MNKVSKQMLTTVALACASGIVFGQETAMETYAQVSHVTMIQDAATQNVTVRYDLDNGGEPSLVRLDILTNGVSIGAENIKTLSGDVTSETNRVADGTDKKITWNARADWQGHLTTNAQAHVMAFYTNLASAVYAPGVYMVVDLSGGPSAESYPVSYTFKAPDPLIDPSCCSNKLYLKRIEPGPFLMGTATNEIGHNECVMGDSQHLVTLEKACFVGIFEMTQKQYQLIMNANPSGSVATTPLYPVVSVSYATIRGNTNATDNINWPLTGTNVANGSFLSILRSKTGIAFDLPTEAQWEYACRAGTSGGVWPNGSAITSLVTDVSLDAFGWYSGNANAIMQVGLLRPNAWGLYDMLGNVMELCLDWGDYGVDYLTIPRIGPRGFDGNISSKEGRRIARGGSFDAEALYCRSVSRNATNFESAFGFMGFRLFWTLP